VKEKVFVTSYQPVHKGDSVDLSYIDLFLSGSLDDFSDDGLVRRYAVSV